MLCVVIITTIILLSVYYYSFICGVQQAWATGEIWRNLGELDASSVAVMLYQLLRIFNVHDIAWSVILVASDQLLRFDMS